jgi:outer membrane immunogenic protein
LLQVSVFWLCRACRLRRRIFRAVDPYKAPAYVAQYNWTGFYLGINGGGGLGDSDWNGFAVSNSPSGGMIGGTAGYNWQGAGSPWVFGLEGDIDWTNIKDSSACGG